MKLFFPAISAALWCCLAAAASTPPPVRAEIDALLTRLQASGCQFSRNGSWHSGSEAKEHLLRKLEHLESKETVQSAERFIELAASRSSWSGQAYQVKCAGASPVESQVWLSRQLEIIRVSSSHGNRSPAFTPP
ncbi:MAG: DUF5329 domain-containing protein [Candidatus Accumulibacter sp.]|jgi:hypothetical protein|nr:DUF5329 domain-containing protein [Accumulibacter sp.]